MAKTYAAIQTITLTSTASSVTFSNIPQNYVDLAIRMSSADARTGIVVSDVVVNFNNTGAGTNVSNKYLYGNGSSAISSTGTQIGFGEASQSNIFGNSEVYIPNYTSGTYKAYQSDSVAESNSSAGYQLLVAGLWSNTSPINSITLTPFTSPFTAGSTFTLYGIGQGAKATGGTVVGAGNYIYHAFTSSGTFTPTESIKNAEVLMVAGGGAGGGIGNGTNQAWDGAGGGGAGGVVYLAGQSFTAGTSYVTQVGAGGTGGYKMASTSTNGGNSQVGALTAAIGGGGVVSGAGQNGGSGAGASGYGTFGTGTLGQGNNGGNKTGGDGGAGGGGAGGVGGSVSTGPNGAPGGVGTASYTSWLYAINQGDNQGGTYYVAGGGGGAAYGYTGTGGNGTGAAGGFGGGGAGASGNNNGGNGVAYTGGGGGGASQTATNATTGGNGGSGLVIIRYQVN